MISTIRSWRYYGIWAWRYWPQARRVILGVVLMALVVAGPGIYGSVTSSSDSSLRQANTKQDVQVSLGFKPQVFHQTQLRKLGIFGGTVDGKVVLMKVSPQNLKKLSQMYWIDMIQPK